MEPATRFRRRPGAGDFTTDPPAQSGDWHFNKVREFRRATRSRGRKREKSADDRSRSLAKRPPARGAGACFSLVELRPPRPAIGNRRRWAWLRSFHTQLAE